MTDEQYYSDKERLTNSMTNWILTGPGYFKKKMALIGLEESSADYLVFGNAVHCKLLERQEFSKRYYVQTGNRPSNAIQKKFCDMLAAHNKSDQKARTSAYKMSYSIKNMKDSDVEEKSKALYIKFKEYIEVKKRGLGKIELSQYDFNRIKAIENIVKSHKSASKLLSSEDIVAYNELVILFNHNNLKMKSKLDRLEIDFTNKIIRLIDVKTHFVKREGLSFSKSFKMAFRNYKYHKQMYFYFLATKRFFEETYKGYDFDDFKFEVKIIAIKSNPDHDVIVFHLGGNYLIAGMELFTEAMEKYTYYEENGYQYSYETNEQGEEILEYE